MNYTKVIIGSSPVCLLEAIYSEKKGGVVAIIDNAPVLGGAWKKLDSGEMGIRGVELGCHIFEKDKEVFRFFKKIPGLALKKMDPQPAIVFGNRQLPYNLKNFFFLFRDIKYYTTYKYGFRHFLLNSYIFLKEIRQLGLKYYTFEKDSVSMVEALSTQVKKAGIEVHVSTTMTDVSIDTKSGIIELTTAKGEIITTSKLVLTYSSDFKRILIDGKDRTALLQKQEHTFIHVHLFVHDPQITVFSYLRIFNNPMIHRISDMSSQVELEKDQHLVCVGIFPSFIKNQEPDTFIPNILSALQEMKLFSGSVKVLSSNWNSYSSNTSDLNDLREIEKESNNLVEVIYTPDIMIGIRKNLHKFNAEKKDLN